MKKRVSIYVLLLITIALLLLIIWLFTGMLEKNYDTYMDIVSDSNHKLVELAEVRECVRDMETFAKCMITEDTVMMNQFLDNHNEQYYSALEKLTELKEAKSDREYYYAYDLIKMLDYYSKHFENFKELCFSNTREIYLRDTYESLDRVIGYILNEIDRAYAYYLRNTKNTITAALDSNQQLRNRSNTISIVILLICTIVLGIMSTAIIMPVRTLKKRMNHYTEYQEDLDIPYSGLELLEIADISNTYTNLIQEINQKRAIEIELYKQQMQNMEMKSLLESSELHMLQMQINPHFLFNTLNSIHSLAEIESATLAATTIEQLSTILRYSLNTGKRNVTLGEELEVVKDYIEIQRLRFGNRFSFKLDIPTELFKTQIPCMIIQPIIENSIQHGFEGMKTGGLVECIGREDKGILTIKIRDNGKGMDQNKVKQIRSMEHIPKPEQYDSHHGIGLDNVLKRMEILYGENHVRITSDVNCGTEIELIIPVQVSN